MRKNQFYEAKITVLTVLSIMLFTFATISPAEAYGQGQYQSGNVIYIDESSPFHDNSKYLNPYKYRRMNMSNAPFAPVPLTNLDNLKLLHWNLTDAQLKQCYDIALKISKPCANFSLKDKLKYIAANVRAFHNRYVSYSTKAPHFLDAYGFYVLNSASCQGAACAVGLCLNLLGIEYEHVNHNKWTHQWCRVKVGNTYWICDAYGVYCGPEPAPYKHPYF